MHILYLISLVATVSATPIPADVQFRATLSTPENLAYTSTGFSTLIPSYTPTASPDHIPHILFSDPNSGEPLDSSKVSYEAPSVTSLSELGNDVSEYKLA
ncbi:hypothetical protein CAAN1_13S03598 [[Candida] anglica]|uniref:Uncharacterized protein n=1 Tax=[Candida] anglica TaxID=148631 RepID=A0ABP0EGA7_9ASCO